MADQPHYGSIAPGEAVVRSRPLSPALLEGVIDVPPVRVESAESPHCIALQVATVRCNVVEKLALTCDDAQMPWSGDGRHLLCKQKAAGSSPVVSTVGVKALLT